MRSTGVLAAAGIQSRSTTTRAGDCVIRLSELEQKAERPSIGAGQSGTKPPSNTGRFANDPAETVLYQAPLADPTPYTCPWTLVLPVKRTEERMFEFACHVGNYGLADVLRGARLEERADLPARRSIASSAMRPEC